jgi:hypothetical protein
MNAGAAVAAAIAQAIKASGTIVRVEPQEFQLLLSRQAEPLVVHAMGGIFNRQYQYLMSYKGIAFFTKSPEALAMPRHAEVVVARAIWMPH